MQAGLELRTKRPLANDACHSLTGEFIAENIQYPDFFFLRATVLI